MKKLLLLGAVAIFGAINAQTTFGLKAGYALSNLKTNEDLSDYEDFAGLKSKSGFYVGGLVEHKFNDKVALQGEVQYANLGGKIEISQNGVTVTENFNFNRLLIPIAVKYYTTPQFAILAGPYASLKLSTKTKIKVKGAQVDQSTVEQGEAELDKAFNDGLKSSDFGLFAGAEYHVGKGIFVDARYSFGLTNLIKDAVNDEKLNMNYFQIGFGYRFK